MFNRNLLAEDLIELDDLDNEFELVEYRKEYKYMSNIIKTGSRSNIQKIKKKKSKIRMKPIKKKNKKRKY